MRGRAYRRHQAIRAYNRAVRLAAIWGDHRPGEDPPAWVQRWARDRRPCSCFICSQGKRKHSGPSISELRRTM